MYRCLLSANSVWCCRTDSRRAANASWPHNSPWSLVSECRPFFKNLIINRNVSANKGIEYDRDFWPIRVRNRRWCNVPKGSIADGDRSDTGRWTSKGWKIYPVFEDDPLPCHRGSNTVHCNDRGMYPSRGIVRWETETGAHPFLLIRFQ